MTAESYVEIISATCFGVLYLSRISTHVSGGRMFSRFVMHVLAFRFTAIARRERRSLDEPTLGGFSLQSEVTRAKLGRLEESRHLVVLNFGGPY